MIYPSKAYFACIILVLLIGFIIQYYNDWQIATAVSIANSKLLCPLECLRLDELSWVDYLTQPSTSVRNAICSDYFLHVTLTTQLPNPVLVFVKFASLLVIEPSRVVFDVIYTIVLVAYIHLGIAGVFATFGCTCASVYGFIFFFKRHEQREVYITKNQHVFCNEESASCRIFIDEPPATFPNMEIYRRISYDVNGRQQLIR